MSFALEFATAGLISFKVFAPYRSVGLELLLKLKPLACRTRVRGAGRNALASDDVPAADDVGDFPKANDR